MKTRLYSLLLLLLSNLALAENDDWYRNATIYHIWLKSFANAGAEHQVGNIRGIIERFDYLNDGDANSGTDLGVDTILLSPFYMSARSSEDPLDNIHGYDVIDYYQVNPIFGTKQDLKELLALAHSRQVKVIFDFVPAYTSIQHPWFIDSAAGGDKRDWYVWDSAPSSRWEAAWGGGNWRDVWHRHGSSYFYGYFQSSEIADLNQHNPAVRQELLQVLKYWLDFGFDGARIDGAPYLIEDGPGKQADRPGSFEILREYRQLADSYSPAKVLIGETWRPSDKVAGYFGDGSNQIQMGFDFEFAWLVANAVSSGKNSSLQRLLEEQQQNYPPGYQMVNFLSNHDSYLARPITRYRDSANRAYQAAALQLLSRGTPSIFYGNELGLPGQREPDNELRRPFNWADVEQQTELPNSLLNAYRSLLKVRQSLPFLAEAQQVYLKTVSNRALATARYDGQQAVLVVLNTANRASQVQLDIGHLFDTEVGSLTATPLLGAPKLNKQHVGDQLRISFEQLAAHSVTVVYLGEQALTPIDAEYRDIVAPTTPVVFARSSLPSLYLRGSMNNWDGSLPMTLEQDTWGITLRLERGRYEYKFEQAGKPLWERNWGDNQRDNVGDIDGHNIQLRVSIPSCYRFQFNQVDKRFSARPVGGKC